MATTHRLAGKAFSSALTSLARRALRRACAPEPRGRSLIEDLEQRRLLSTNGLAGTYFDNIDFTGPTVARTDATIDFKWNTGEVGVPASPDPSMQPDSYSVRWRGMFYPDETKTYQFETNVDDGVRLWINDQLLIDHWVDSYSDRPGCGDVNNDGSTNSLDITPFSYALTNGQAAFEQQYPGGNYWNADINGDGLVNNFDATPFVNLITYGTTSVQNWADVDLEAGKAYPIRIEYYQHLKAAIMQLDMMQASFDPALPDDYAAIPATYVSPVSGEATATEGAPYSLYLPISDDNGIPITGWSIDWGDGTYPHNDGTFGESVGATDIWEHTYSSGPTDHSILATALLENGQSQPYRRVDVHVRPAAPVSISAVTVSESEIDLAWLTTHGSEAMFEIQRTSDGSTYAPVATVDGATTTYTDSGLQPGTAYGYRIVTICGTETSDPSDLAATVTIPLPPQAPTGLVAQRTDGQTVSLSWAHDSANTEYFTILRAMDDSAYEQVGIVDAGQTAFTDGDLVAEHAYSYKVAAVNGAGHTENSGGSVGVPPTGSSSSGSDGPADPSMSADVVDSHHLRLTYVVTEDSVLELEEKAPLDDNYRLINASLDGTPGQHTLVVDNLAAGKSYSFRLRAERNGLLKYATTTATTLPEPPPSDRDYPVTLNAPTGAFMTGLFGYAQLEFDSEYQISLCPPYDPGIQWRATDPYGLIGTSFNAVSSFGELGHWTIGFEASASPLQYQVQMRLYQMDMEWNVVGVSPWVDAGTVTIQPPPERAALPPTPHLTTSEPTQDGNVRVGYEVGEGEPSDQVVFYRVIDGVTQPLGVSVPTGAIAGFVTVPAMPHSQILALTVGPGTTTTSYSGYSNLVSGDGNVRPLGPWNLNATRIQSGRTHSVRLVWDNVSGIETGYSIERATDPEFTINRRTIGAVGADQSSYVDTIGNDDIGVAFYYRVRDQRNGVWSDYSNTSSTPGGPIYVGFFGADLRFPFIGPNEGNQLMQQLADGIANGDPGAGIEGSQIRMFESLGSDRALRWLLERLDLNHDGKYDPAHGDQARAIHVFGHSWGGVTAVKLTRMVRESDSFIDKSIAKLTTIDPVMILRNQYNGIVPANVQYFTNIYQSKNKEVKIFGFGIHGQALEVEHPSSTPPTVASQRDLSTDPSLQADIRDAISHFSVISYVAWEDL